MTSVTSLSQFSNISTISEQQFQPQFELHYNQVKSFIESYEEFRNTIKKFQTALNQFSSSLADMAKRERSTQGEQPLEAINGSLATFIGNFSNNIKSVSHIASQQMEQCKMKLDTLKEFKMQMKRNYEDQNKQFQKLKKDYQTSKEKMDDLKCKLNEYQKQNEKKDPQQEMLLKHDYKYASQEVKTRQQNKNDCLKAFNHYLLSQVNEKDKLFNHYIGDTIAKVTVMCETFSAQMLSQLKKYEQFLVPMIKEVQVKTQDRANSSMMKLQQDESENDRSMISQYSSKGETFFSCQAANIFSDATNLLPGKPKRKSLSRKVSTPSVQSQENYQSFEKKDKSFERIFFDKNYDKSSEKSFEKSYEEKSAAKGSHNSGKSTTVSKLTKAHSRWHASDSRESVVSSRDRSIEKVPSLRARCDQDRRY